MPSITAIELGADTCALARTALHRGAVHVSAAELLNPTAFPGADAFTAALRKARRKLGLPRRCRVVVWGLPDGANRKDPAATAVLTPLSGAGFRVERVVTPCNALAALARRRPVRGDGPACWVAINGGGVAIVAVRPGQLLYSHSFAWDSTVGASGSQARLLQRYSLVAFLAPEVKRAMHAARALGFPITAVVTCGNLPDLRSLTMPLIEELDVEVETLDSLDGLVVKPAAAERLTEIAAAIRLACAATIARATRPWDGARLIAVQRTRALLRAAAVLAVIAALVGAYFVYERWRSARTAAPPPVAQTTRTAPPSAGEVRGTRGSQTQRPPASQATATRGTPPAVSAPPLPSSRVAVPTAGTVAAPQGRASSPPSPSTPPAQRAVIQPRERLPLPPTLPAPVPRATAPPATAPPATVPPATAPPATVTPAPPSTAAPAPPAAASPTLPGLPAPLEPRWSPQGASAPQGRATPVRPPPPVRLTDPLPRVTAILVSNDRRFATVNAGRVVGVGDTIGRRVVVRIDERALTLREPSGLEIRVGLGGRLLNAPRGG